jgi:EAL domain-containing protein (putative c-di-GMP-specific phosphodiesterase class I)
LINKSGQSIVKSIINFTKELGIKTVAEFVCSKEIYDLLKEMDIDYFQGYYISKPLSIEQLKNWKKDV